MEQATDPRHWPHLPSVSVIAPAWNEAGCLEDFVRSYRSLSYPNKTMVLCAGGPDGTLDLARRLAGPDLSVLEQPAARGRQPALRDCLAACDGEIVYQTDSDCILTDECFQAVIAPIARGEAVATTGMTQPKVEQRGNLLVQYQWYRVACWRHRIPRTVAGMLGGNSAVRRDVLVSVGGFDADVTIGEDTYLARCLVRAGHEIRSAPAGAIHTRYADSPGAYLRKRRRLNRTQIVCGFRFRAWSEVVRYLVPLGFYTLMLVLPFLGSVVGPLAWGAPLAILAAAMAIRLRRLVRGSRLVGRSLSWGNLLTLPFFTLVDVAGVLGAFVDLLLPRLRNRW